MEHPDYTAMEGPEMYVALGADAAKWAAAFCQHVKKLDGHEIDEGWAIGWFANAMMAMHDFCLPEHAPVVLPDGSAFFVGAVK